MSNPTLMPKSLAARFGRFILFLLIGLVVFLIFSHFRPMLPASIDLPARVALALVLLSAAWLARRRNPDADIWRLLLALFAASLAMLLDRHLPLSQWALRFLDLDLQSPAGLAIDKLESTVLIALPILAITISSGADLGSIYLKKGNLKRGLLVGTVAVVTATLVSFPLAEWMFGAQELSLARAIPWTPWILIFILGNAFNEELLFRGIFLRKLEPFFGASSANILIAIVFTLHHAGVQYSPDAVLFMIFLFPLAFAWGKLMQDTDSIWGSMIFHAAMDIPVVLSLFSTLS